MKKKIARGFSSHKIFFCPHLLNSPQSSTPTGSPRWCHVINSWKQTAQNRLSGSGSDISEVVALIWRAYFWYVYYLLNTRGGERITEREREAWEHERTNDKKIAPSTTAKDILKRKGERGREQYIEQCLCNTSAFWSR